MNERDLTEGHTQLYPTCSSCEFLKKENSNLKRLLAEQKSTRDEVIF